MRRRWLLAVLGIATALAAWGTARGVDSWQYRAKLAQAKARIAAGSPAEACRLLADAVVRWPGEGEVAFLLGACEQALGRPDSALAAWSRVPSDSPFAGHAAMLRVRLLLKRDQFAAAEALLPAALRASGQHALEARETLVVLFRLEGRFAELRTVVQEAWDTYPDRMGLLRQLANLDSINPVPIERIWPALEKAAENAPDDDRIWLGRANLAIRTGQFADAKRRLDDCLRRRPDDSAVWRGRVEWALATGDVAEARRALEHLSPASVAPQEALALGVWFAAQAGDLERERQRLETLLEIAPSHFPALERLAELDLRAGRTDRAARLRKQKAEMDLAKIRYEMLVTRPSSEALRHVNEMAPLAELLGRTFEARALWSLVLETVPNHKEARAALARLVQARSTRVGATLADLLTELGAA
jgi:enediyne biosynthesis protein E4